MFTLLLPEESGLPVSVYMDDGYAAVSNNHPVVIFVQNSYNHHDHTYQHLICLSVDENPENVFETSLRITKADYLVVRFWVIRNRNLIIQLSHRIIDIFELLKKYWKEIDLSKAEVSEYETINKINYLNHIQDYIVVEDVATGKFSLVSKRTDDNVLDNKWYDAIIPTIKKEGDKEFIGIWNGEVMTYAEIKK